MSNVGHYKDRYPIICAAGKPSTPNTSVDATFREYNLQDKIDALKHDFNVKIDKKPSYVPDKLPIVENIRHRGSNDRILNHLKYGSLSRYQQLITDLKETTYPTYWKKEIGKATDSVPGLPLGLDTITTTFGHKPKEHISAYEVILPNIPRTKVLWDSQINHDNYKKIFNDYNPGEKLSRNYIEPYNINNCAGHKTTLDNRGVRTACALKWFNEEPLTVASKVQVDYYENHHSKLGKKDPAINFEEYVPNDHSFGLPLKRDMYGVEELLKPGCEPSLYKKKTLERMASLNLLRQTIKKKFSPTFTLNDFFQNFAHYDQALTKFISLEKFYLVISRFNIHINREKLEELFTDLGIIKSGHIDYTKFIEAIQFDLELGKQLDPLPKEKLNYCSESTAANYDHYFINNATKRPAGLSSRRFEIKVPPKRGCESNRNDLPTDDVKTLLRRSILLQYNISYRDMFRRRTKEFIKTLFENCGYQFDEGSFDNLYKKAEALDQMEDEAAGVCVDTFYKVLKENLPPLKVIVDEIDCDPKQLRKL